MTRQKTIIAAVAILAAGALAGWGASRVVRSPDPSSTSVDGSALAVNPEEPLTGMTPQQPYEPQPAPVRRTVRTSTPYRGITLPAGTGVRVTVNQSMSTKTTGTGDSWTGTVADDVYRNGRVVIPAGSRVNGTVAVSQAPRRGERATLQLAMSSVVVNGRTYTVHGRSEPVVAGSPRARNVGAIAGGTAAGALLGKAIGGSSKSTLIGAVVGGGAATAAVAKSKGFQVTIPAGRELAFTTTRSASLRA